MKIDTISAQEPATEESEAYQTLLARLGKKSPSIPPDLLVRHILACVPAHEWPVRVEALDALVRRLESVKREELRLKVRPDGGRLLGDYVTSRPGAGARPYRTRLAGVEPINARCDCPDFLKNSLGICKHVLAVLAHIHAKPRVLQNALAEQARVNGQSDAGLRWDPIRPLTGAGDWLERITWHGPAGSRDIRDERTAAVLKWFKSTGNGTWTLRRAFQEDPARRLSLVEDLLGIFPTRSKVKSRDPALEALLKSERQRLAHVVEQTLSRSELKAAFKGLKRTLYPYQREGVERFLQAGRLLLADDMGLGKTAQAITCANILWNTGRIKRGLIIAPASLKPQWAREWGNFSDLPIAVVDGSPAERAAFYTNTRQGLFIINYEQLIRDLETIRQWNPDLVVLDEAQRIKNWATKTALSVKGLAPPFRLVLTGTPMENRIDELASVVEWVDDMALEPKWRLSSLHAIYADGRREVVGVRHLDTLRERLKHSMVRRIRQDVLDQLPPRTDTRVPVDLTEEQLEEHDALIQPIAKLVSTAKVRPLKQAEFLKLMTLLMIQRIISNGLCQLNFEHIWPTIQSRKPDESVIKSLFAPKLLELRQLIRQLVLEQKRKIVVFSQWRRMLTLAHWAISDLLKEEGLRAGFFTGAEGPKRRTQNIVEFHDDPNFRLLFASDAGGVGLNLQHASNCVINLELPWNPAVLEQRIGRVYRLGQKLPIDVYNLVSEQGIESRIASLVGSKQAFFKGLFDGDSDTVQFDQSSSFLSKVEKLYETMTPSAPSANGDADEIDLSDVNLDDEVTDELEPLLEAADETQDALAASNGVETSEAIPAAPRGEAATRSTAASEPLALPGSNEVRQLFSQLKISRASTGNVVIEAPPEAATALSALFEGMAALLRDSAGDA
jgi:superfamily II DNA or RNA helicase